MNRHEAFATLISKRLWYEKAGLTRMQASVLKNRFNKGQLSEEAMRKTLEACSWIITVQEKWEPNYCH